MNSFFSTTLRFRHNLLNFIQLSVNGVRLLQKLNFEVALVVEEDNVPVRVTRLGNFFTIGLLLEAYHDFKTI